ncbi:MAG: shikimate dehydrogenase, partial [Dinghuibacter sp.]|nr:shikimate dehydrogenase [Dinghuibacter sp.]
PLTHTSSPAYFRAKFEREAIPGCDYRAFPLAHISEFPGLLQQYPELEGLSVTIPHKETVLQYAHHRSPVVQACGATNCLKITNGNIYAHNTDAIGFEHSLTPLLQPHHQKALVLGTGGAAKAVAWVLKEKGVHHLFVTRNEQVQNENTIAYKHLDNRLLAEYTLIVNASPAGMLPHADTLPPIPYAAIGAQHLLYDLVYKPEKTLFLQKGEARGAVIKNGYEMLVLQAEAAWAIWNEQPV